MAQPETGKNPDQEQPKAKQPPQEDGALEKAQEEAAVERKEEGGYQ